MTIAWSRSNEKARAGAEAASEETMGFGLFEADGELVGGFGLHRRRGPGILEIGYWVRSDRTGRGYATGAARALTQAAFDGFPDVDRLEIRWPGGAIETIDNLAANQIVTVTEGKGVTGRTPFARRQ